ncbi:MAG: peptidase [Acidobacteriota bacterium]|jgi:hypothetical protein|nr:peptidase [Acidobacteriota bacterium]
MNLKTLVKISNTVATISILLLIYWVFVFITVEVFGLKVFRENMSETFFMSVLGILALMGGSLMINVMFNLTRIAQKHNQDEIIENRNFSRKFGLGLLLLFPILFGLLFSGDYLTSKKKEAVLIQSAKSVIDNNPRILNKLVNYEFTENWLLRTDETLDLMSKTDKNFPYVSVIVEDSIDNSDVYLGFSDYARADDKNYQPKKKNFIFSASKLDRDYLNKVFNEGYAEKRFTAHDGKYELFYPYFEGDKKIVLYFSDFQQYGKLGS